MITQEFKAQVEAARAEGLSWPKVARKLGRPERTCKRALKVGQPKGTCAERGCTEPTTPSGRYCEQHARERMGRSAKPTRQEEVMKLMREHGSLTSEQLRNLTGMNSDMVGQVTIRLLKQGLIERPTRGRFTLPRAHEYRPEHPIPPQIEYARDR